MKSIAIVLVVAVLGILAWVLLHSGHHIAVVVNGHPLVGPARLAAEGWGLLVGIVALFCTAILLVFVFAGTALIVFGAFVFAGFVAACFVFPFLLPLLVPLFLVWIFVAAARRARK